MSAINSDVVMRANVQRHLEDLRSPGNPLVMVLGTVEQMQTVGKIVGFHQDYTQILSPRGAYPKLPERHCVVACYKEPLGHYVYAIYSYEQIMVHKESSISGTSITWGILEISKETQDTLIKMTDVGNQTLADAPIVAREHRWINRVFLSLCCCSERT